MPGFDLNVERMLEHWTVAHALRELIANALDEAALTGTEDPVIDKDHEGCWHVRDFGRGLRYEHLTQKEDRDKLRRADLVVGKFGVGLKDALATFDRRDARIAIHSSHADMKLTRQGKHGFEDLKTLHVLVDAPSDPAMVGTDISIHGIRDEDMDAAKALFLRYSGDELLEHTTYGAVLRRAKGHPARIYVNGLRVAEEADFLFSYDITSQTAALRRALNRERSNVGRSAYQDRVKTILLAATSESVADALAADLRGYETGKGHDETKWLDVALHACRILNAAEKVVFLTSWEIASAPAYVKRAKDDGYRVVTVPDELRRKLPGTSDIVGNPIIDLDTFSQRWNESFEFTLVDEKDLTDKERAVFARTRDIVGLQGAYPRQAKAVQISETMRINAAGTAEVVGYWDPDARRIVVKRDQLKTLPKYAGTLLHEVTHATGEAGDLSSEFEEALTRTLGVVAARFLQR